MRRLHLIYINVIIFVPKNRKAKNLMAPEQAQSPRPVSHHASVDRKKLGGAVLDI